MQKYILYAMVVFLSFSCRSADKKVFQTSPDQKLKVEFLTVTGNIPAYRIIFNQKTILDTSLLGFELKGLEKS